MELSTYGMSRERGYLSDFEIDTITLPSALDGPVQAAGDLSAILTSGRARHWLAQVPQPDMAAFLAEASDAQIRVAMVHYSFMVQAYVWGEEHAPESLPANLAVPICALAERLGQAPLLPYSGYVLDNWYRLDKAGDIALDNIAMHQNFLGGMDENWFVLIHVAIEAEAGRALELATELVDASDAGDADRVETLLQTMHTVWDRVNAHFDRMPERCDPYIYYQRVRPYIHGWKNNAATPNGLVYEGVERFGGKPQAFRGQTGSQSSIVPAMDALFNVCHENDPLREYLDELHAYRPIPHRQFIEDLAEASSLRAFATNAPSGVKDAFNACVEQVARFRTRHLEYAASYINKQACSGAGNDTDVGTGGTPFMKYLKKHRDENRAQLV
ncbi:MAG: indoleamine 2,3-dioxygenase [Parasphingopyxis sp.]|uniref:indoleamine 2,3-dioxygenase n=1 Tax=Parasphingopyxis sp. TaxID=1920299 RepID=UPI003FA08673